MRFPKDVRTTGEKIEYVAVIGFVGFLILFMQLSAFGVFNNLYARACEGEGAWKIAGLLLSAASVYMGYRESQRAANVGRIIIIVAIYILALGAYAGFDYPYNM